MDIKVVKALELSVLELLAISGTFFRIFQISFSLESGISAFCVNRKSRLFLRIAPTSVENVCVAVTFTGAIGIRSRCRIVYQRRFLLGKMTFAKSVSHITAYTPLRRLVLSGQQEIQGPAPYRIPA